MTKLFGALSASEIHLLWRDAREANSTTGIVLALSLADDNCRDSGKRPVRFGTHDKTVATQEIAK